MVAGSDHLRRDTSLYLQNILDEPEEPGLHRLTTMVGHLFGVPVAYLALLDSSGAVVSRLGCGTEYARYLRSVQPNRLLEEPQLVRDSTRELSPGTDLADLRFAASAVLRTTSGLQLGVLVIADRVARPNFSAADLRALSDLAEVFAGKLELRMIASMAMELQLSRCDSEHCFRAIADAAPVPLIYRRADGTCLFVNQAWLDFTGRTLEQELEDGWAGLIHQDYRKPVMEEYWRSFEALRQFTVEAPVQRHDGQYRWMLGRGAPRFHEDGSFAGYVGCLIDITCYRETPGMQDCGAVRCPCGRLCPINE